MQRLRDRRHDAAIGILVFADHLIALDGQQGPVSCAIDEVADKPDAAVAKSEMDAPGMPAAGANAAPSVTGAVPTG